MFVEINFDYCVISYEILPDKIFCVSYFYHLTPPLSYLRQVAVIIEESFDFFHCILPLHLQLWVCACAQRLCPFSFILICLVLSNESNGKYMCLFFYWFIISYSRLFVCYAFDKLNWQIIWLLWKCLKKSNLNAKFNKFLKLQ